MRICLSMFADEVWWWSAQTYSAWRCTMALRNHGVARWACTVALQNNGASALAGRCGSVNHGGTKVPQR